MYITGRYSNQYNICNVISFSEICTTKTSELSGQSIFSQTRYVKDWLGCISDVIQFEWKFQLQNFSNYCCTAETLQNPVII